MDWIDHFRQNARRRITIDWSAGIDVPAEIRPALVRSIQRFQVGESGEGRHLRAHAAATGDAVYAEAIRLFLSEEHVHASYLRRILDLLGEPTIAAHWTDALFIAGRRLLGLRLEITTLLAAEMVAMYYYRMIRDGVADPTIRRVCAQVLRDEAAHVAFHADTLARDIARRSAPMRTMMRLALRSIHTCAVFVVALDHRDLINALGVRPGAFLRECDAVYDRVDRRIFERAGESQIAIDAAVEHGWSGGAR